LRALPEASRRPCWAATLQQQQQQQWGPSSGNAFDLML